MTYLKEPEHRDITTATAEARAGDGEEHETREVVNYFFFPIIRVFL